MSITDEIRELPIGEKIRHVLLLRKKSATDLATEFNMTRQGMAYKLDNGAFDIEEVKRVAVWLDLDPKDFME